MRNTDARPVAAAEDITRQIAAWVAGTSWPALNKWWNAQQVRTQLAVLVAGLFVFVGVLNLISAAGRSAATTRTDTAATAESATPAASAPALVAESAPTEPGKSWVVTRLWQGTGNRETEAFSVSGHWRIDYLFNPSQPNANLQVFIYAANGRLLMHLAANTKQAGADTSFWAGSGTYFLKVNSSGGDWKVDVQEYR